jgi:4-amino-4-deoxy-L-arabinose transferase-like glycosyltransferase
MASGSGVSDADGHASSQAAARGEPRHIVARLVLSQRALSKAAAHLPFVGLFVLFVFTGFRGIDFGFHWDEVSWQIEPVREMARTGLFMPRAGIYPAFTKWLILLPALARGVAKALEVGLRPNLIQAAMVATLDRPDYLLAARRVFVVVSALAMVWTYCAALTLRLRVWQAFVAAATLGLSWEFAYHSRWVATDCITVQFCALTLWLLLWYLRNGRPNTLYGAAVATGLAIGTKFPVAPLLGVLLLVGASKLSPYRLREQLSRALILGCLAVGSYLVTTPATLLEPFKFLELAQYISTRYQHGHYGSTVGLGPDHLYRVLLYFAVSYFSPYRVLSLLLAAGVVAGGFVWWRKSRAVALLLIGFPLLFLSFFCFHYAAFQARNYLLLAPSFALLLAGALGALVDALTHVTARALVWAALAGAAGANAVFLVSAAESIRHRSELDDVRQALAYATARPETHFKLSNDIREIARRAQLTLPSNVTARKPDHVMFFAPSEGPLAWDWPANDPFAVERTFGPREVNLDWYPTWLGDRHILLMTLEEARHIGVPFVRH